MKRILTGGSLAYDRIMDFDGEFKDHFLPDKLHAISVSFLVDGVKEMYGGTAGNIAYNLALLKCPTSILGTAGKDFTTYEERLSALDIDTSTIAVDADLPTAAAYIMTDRTDAQISAFAPGAGGKAYDRPIDFTNAGLVIVAPAAVMDMERLAKEAKVAGVPCFFDPGQQTVALSSELMRAGIEGATALLVNDYELALVIEKTGWSEEELRMRVEMLIVTLGAQGSRVITKEGETRIAAAGAVAKDPTGAGDAYRGGFAAAYVAGLSAPLCAEVGSTIASFAVEAHGTQAHTPSIEELTARYESVYGKNWPL